MGAGEEEEGGDGASKDGEAQVGRLLVRRKS